LAGEEGLTSYKATWGVLAKSAAEAAELALKWQSKCFPLDAHVLDTELGGETYTEHIGVVWQRLRDGT
jgi:hypothetical protein